jgi:hypothetical protein
MRSARGVRLVPAALGALAIACGAGDPPRLEVTALPRAESASSGVVQAGFQIANVGGRELALDGAAPACGCRIVSPLPAALQPGATTSLAVRCRALGAEQASRAMHLWSSDPASPDTVIHVDVGPVAATEPPALYFGYVAIGAVATRDVVLPPGTGATAAPPPADAAFTFETIAARPDGRAAVRVRYTPRNAGPAMTALDLGADVSRLLVTGVGHGSVVAFPSALRLPSTGSGALPAITIKAIGEAPIDPPRIEYPPGLAGELRTVTTGRQFRLAVRARGPLAAGDAIRIHTPDAASPVLVIPVDAAGPAAAPKADAES